MPAAGGEIGVQFLQAQGTRIIRMAIAMKIEDVRAMAMALGVYPGKPSITGLVQAIQVAEGNFDCFSSAADCECDQVNCRWRDDCFAYSGAHCQDMQHH